MVLETLLNGQTNGRDGRSLQTIEFIHLTKGQIRFLQKEVSDIDLFYFLTIHILGNYQSSPGSETSFSQE